MVLTADQSAAAHVNDFPPFDARASWLGGDLQTLRNSIVGRHADLSSWPDRCIVEFFEGMG